MNKIEEPPPDRFSTTKQNHYLPSNYNWGIVCLTHLWKEVSKGIDPIVQTIAIDCLHELKTRPNCLEQISYTSGMDSNKSGMFVASYLRRIAYAHKNHYLPVISNASFRKVVIEPFLKQIACLVQERSKAIPKKYNLECEPDSKSESI